MKKVYILTPVICLSLLFFGFKNNIFTLPVYTDLPTNAQGTGTIVTPTRFSGWIGGVTPAVNVFVNAADGPNFIGDINGTANNADFFRWSEQMFLWILSPTPSNGSYGNCGGLVLNSPAFYDYNTSDNNYYRHSCRSVKSTSKGYKNTIDVGNSMSFDIKSASKGSKNLPIFFEKGTNKIYDVDNTPKSKNGYQLVHDLKGNEIEVGSIKVKNNVAFFYNLKGQIIESASLILSKNLDKKTTAQQFVFRNNTLTLVSGGSVTIVILPNQNQANGNNILMARNGSLVYYNIMVNDVFAVFSTMIYKGILPADTPFPTTLSELNTIKAYAVANNISIVDTNNHALAMELKTSWVEATNYSSNYSLSASDYITINATIPNYVQTSSTTWTRQGTRSTTLALVGMHVVGSVAGHSEMVWSTFEHKNNCPMAFTYTPMSSNPTPSSFPTSTATTNWLFSSPTHTGSFNIPYIKMSGSNIAAAAGYTISPSDTNRNIAFGWGGLVGQQSTNNPTDVLPQAEANALVAATNADVNSNLISGDVRKNYFFVGATWKSSLNDTSSHQPHPISGVSVYQAGMVKLSNATMETYTQSTSVNTAANDTNLNCFSCHEAHLTNQEDPIAPAQTNLSHVFGASLIP